MSYDDVSTQYVHVRSRPAVTMRRLTLVEGRSAAITLSQNDTTGRKDLTVFLRDPADAIALQQAAAEAAEWLSGSSPQQANDG